MTCRQKQLLIVGLLAWGMPADSTATECGGCLLVADSLEVTERSGAAEAQQVLAALDALVGSGDVGDRSVCLLSTHSDDFVCIPVRPMPAETP